MFKPDQPSAALSPEREAAPEPDGMRSEEWEEACGSGCARLERPVLTTPLKF